MQIGWSIICASGAVQRIQDSLSEILRIYACCDHAQPHVMPYWRVPECCVINCEYLSKKLSAVELEKQVRKLSGLDDLDVLQQGDCIEFTASPSIEEILGSNEIAFVVCFANMKENVI